MSLWQNITLGRYYPGNSTVHGLDPRTKLISCAILLSAALAVESWLALTWLGGVIVAAIAVAKLPLRLFLKNLRAFLWLFGITVVLHAFSDPEAPHLNLWGISISWPGILTGGRYAFRMALLVTVAAVLSFTTIPTDLTNGLHRMLRPLQRLKIPVHELALMVALALRFLPAIVEEAQRIQRAQISRGARFDGNLLQRVQALTPMLVPLFMSTFSRADELAVAMEARCYHCGEGRMTYRELALSRTDYMALLLSGVAGATAVGLAVLFD